MEGPALLPAQESAQSRHEVDRLAKRRRSGRRGRRSGKEAEQGLPFGVLEVDRTRDVRNLSAELGEMENAPCDDQIDRDAHLKTMRRGELAILNSAAALERAVIDLDLPAQGVPGELLGSLLILNT